MRLTRKTYYTFPLAIFITFILTFSNCKKDNNDDIIPYVPVNFTIYLSLPEYAALNSPGNHVLIDGGYRGIVVYRSDLSTFVAFDRACPYDPTATNAKLNVDSSGLTMVDPNCGSKFNLIDGSILNGPSTRPMKAYHADYQQGTNTVSIYN